MGKRSSFGNRGLVCAEFQPVLLLADMSERPAHFLKQTLIRNDFSMIAKSQKHVQHIQVDILKLEPKNI